MNASKDKILSLDLHWHLQFISEEIKDIIQFLFLSVNVQLLDSMVIS